jgi:hypothetical protein
MVKPSPYESLLILHRFDQSHDVLDRRVGHNGVGRA